MTPTLRAFPFITAVAAALGVSPLFGAALPTTIAAASSPTCDTPRLIAFVDPARGSAMTPHIDAHWVGLAAPGQVHVSWGNGEYQVAAVGPLQSAGHPVAIDPRYTAPGSYPLTFTVTDACGESHTETMSVTVPLSAAPAPQITCPGTIDPSGYCVVSLGDRVPLRVDDLAAPAGGWTWQSDRPLAGIDPSTRAAAPETSLPDPGAYTVQATAATADGWVVSETLTLVGVARRPDPISRFAAPHTAVAGEPVVLDFDVPAAPMTGVARISVDSDPPIDGSSTTIALTAGSHTISYSVTYPDGSVVQRQTIVVARSAPMSMTVLVTMTIAPIGAIGGLALVFTRWRRRRTGGDPLTPPPSASERDRQGRPTRSAGAVARPVAGDVAIPIASSMPAPAPAAARILPAASTARPHLHLCREDHSPEPPIGPSRRRAAITTHGMRTLAVLVWVMVIDRRSH
jgi:hypothetical protein